MSRVAVVGSLNVDRSLRVPRLPVPGETVRALRRLRSAGGKGANQAVAASLLGAEVSLIGAVGNDEDGQYLLNAVRDRGVDTSAVAHLPVASGEAVILVDEEGENFIVVSGGANLELDPAHVRTHIGDAEIVVTGFEVADEAVEAAADAAIQHNSLFVLNPSPYRKLPRIVHETRLVLVVNEHEYAQVTNDAGIERRLRDAIGVIVTRGAAGAVVYESGMPGSLQVSAPRVAAIDTSGCGDAFTGGLVAALSRGDSLAEAARLGVRAGAYAATRMGTQSSYARLEDLGGCLSA